MSIKQIFYKTFYFIKHKRRLYVFNKKIDALLLKTKSENLRKFEKRAIHQKFKTYGFTNISFKWHRYYSHIYGKNLIEFIPEPLFYTQIETALDRVIMYPALEDKNLLDKFLSKELLPKAVVKNINGFFYVDDVQASVDAAIKRAMEHKELVIKPTMGTVGGTGVKKILLHPNMDNVKKLKDTFIEYEMDFILQEVLRQHEAMSKLNKDSINTVRVMSYMNIDGVHILSAVVRIGRKESFTDNMTLGGFGCGINSKGKLKKYAHNNRGISFEKTDSGTILKGFQIPEYKNILETVKTFHKKLPFFRLISWDVMITIDSKVKIIEFNTLGQDINLHQMANGPLLGPFFDEIMKITQNHDSFKEVMKYGK